MNCSTESQTAAPAGAAFTASDAIPPLVRRADTPAVAEAQKHSGMGIASFGISLTAIILSLTLVTVSGFLKGMTRGHFGEPYPGQSLVGLGMSVLSLANLVAVGLGIASLCERGKKHVFGILGLTFSGSTMLYGICLYALSIARISNPSFLAARTPPAASLTPPPASSQPQVQFQPQPQVQSQPQTRTDIPVSRIVENDQEQVTITVAEGVPMSDAAKERLRLAIEKKIDEKKSLNAPTGLGKQFSVEVNVTTFGTAPMNANILSIEFKVGVYVLPAREKVCYFGVGTAHDKSITIDGLVPESADDAAKCIDNPNMWIAPEVKP